MVLYKEDLKNIGHTSYEGEDGKMVFVSDGVISNIERILLRNILLLFGNYKIVRESDTFDGDSIFYTNFPYIDYVEI